MSFGTTGTKISFQHAIFGTWGRFRTTAGTVEFLETKARIGPSAKDLERRLARALRPVREVLPTQTMDFNQLLQRDLDDHRVATELVRYVLQPSKTGPAFFPPIVAAMLPFEGNEPRPQFPRLVEIDKSTDEIATWHGNRFGSAFQFDRMINPDDGSDFQIKVGRLSWNPEEVKLVVIDGQHRAMALLAIDRTINNTWSESGEKYKYFYEPVIQEILRDKTEKQKQELLEHVEFPVTIVWFPDANAPGGDHHAAARKLFVDVNQTARKPSESRLLLLSDAQLIGIFTRRVLNEFRKSKDALPIYAVEYDHPGRDQASSSKWSAVSNVIILRDCIERAVFGPKKYIENLNLGFGGRESDFERSLFMRQTLQIDEEIGETVEDMERNDISNTDFPRSKLDFLQNQLMRGWGSFVVRMLSEILPYKAHGKALVELRTNWATAGSTDSLAKDAIFEGVGMYWTIRDSYNHWERNNQIRTELNQDPISKTDIVRTWEVIENKKQEFLSLRNEHYIGKSDASSSEAVSGAFEAFSTNACQLGLVLAARTIGLRNGVTLTQMEAFTTTIVEASNAALIGGPKGEHGRRTVFWRGHEDAFNRITKLDTPYAVHFRYFWLELLSTPEAQTRLGATLASTTTGARDEARRGYLSYLSKELEKAIRKAEPSLNKVQLKEKADTTAEEALRKALLKWFGIKRADFEEWRKRTEHLGSTKGGQDAPIDDATTDIASEPDSSSALDTAETTSPSFAELLTAKVENE
jgi:hypothetical protein